MLRAGAVVVEPGVFALIHRKSKTAYVGSGKNLKQRATMWSYHLDAADKNPEYRLPARGLPRYPSDEWEFHGYPNQTVEWLREQMANAGWTVINQKTRVRLNREYEIEYPDGTKATGTLNQHAKHLGLSPAKVVLAYKRIERRYTARQALGLDPLDVLDRRERQIMAMACRIVTDTGGYVTFDEALRLRPEVGDIRSKMLKLRKANPQLTEIKLSDI